VIVVPTLTAGAHASAATWIGVEGPARRGSLVSPFFQVGINELRFTAPGVPVQNAAYAFWSSTSRGFHAVPVFAVKPGDTLYLSMTLRGKHWRISVNDETRNRRRAFSVPLAGRPSFTQAIWQQEDPTDGLTTGLVPYPNLTSVQFSQLSINAASPRARSLQPTWMSTGHRNFGPTKPRQDGFAIVPVHPSAEALEYQRLALKFDLAASLFVYELKKWSASTPMLTIGAAALVYGRALQADISSLQSYPWSGYVRKSIHGLIKATERLRQAVLRAPTKPSNYLAILQHATVTARALQVRVRLHIPWGDPSGASVAKYIQAHASLHAKTSDRR
jgi:Peptidase A4 family